MPRIPVIDHANAQGRLREIYDEILKSRGKIADIHQIQSLRPESIVKHMELYMEIMFSRSPLSRAQREMMAVVVSVANGCQYCTMHHLQALQHYIKEEKALNAIKSWPVDNILDHSNAALCDFARHLTLTPQEHEEVDFTQSLRQQGFSDEAILDAVLVVAYFNFVNRIALSLGLKASESEMKGYQY
ncbi:MAG: peroxidase-related enzyme [Bacteroidales bacterium]|nr:peroxidase-related enzyme [Bacteroidales bacterium]